MLRKYWLYILIGVLLLPAFLINLGLLPFIDDESIRALVAQEMDWSGNFVTPTLHGYYYYNKPPLWNWLLWCSFQLFGGAGEWSARLPTVLCLLAYGATIYAYSVRHFSRRQSFLNALLFLTCGRILLWDSMLALIDICFSWCMFVLFMEVYHRFRRQQWWQLFLITYTLTAIGFMLKGLPAVAFQGITLLTWFAYQRRFWRLFSLPHIAGGLLFLVLVGSYYLAYHQYNSLYEVFPTLLSESSKRTVVQYGIGETILHIVQFPFEMIYHFLPWSLLVIYFFRGGVLQKIRQNDFIVYCLLLFLANIVLYWTSPEVYPRYLLMHAPLIFTVYLYLHQWHRQERSWQYLTLRILFFVVMVAVTLGALYPAFAELPTAVPQPAVKALLLFVPLLGLCYAYWQRQSPKWLLFAAAFLLFRIGFNWFVLPDRNSDDVVTMVREMSTEVGERLRAKPAYVYAYTLMEPTNSFYLENAYDGIIPRKLADYRTDEYYIVNLAQYPLPAYTVVDSFYARHERHMYYVVTLPEPAEAPVEMIHIHDY